MSVRTGPSWAGYLLDVLKRSYFRIGLHTAPHGTLLHKIHASLRWNVHRFLSAPRRVAPKISARQPADKNRTSSCRPFALRVTGGIGDHLIAARYVRDLFAEVGPFPFDLYCTRPEIAAWIFGAFPEMKGCYNEFLEWPSNLENYALALWIQSFVLLYEAEADWRSAFQHNKKLAKVAEDLVRFQPIINHHTQRHPHSDNFLAQEAVMRGANRCTFSHHMSGIAYGGDRLPLETDSGALAKFGLAGRPTITVHNGYDAAFQFDGTRGKTSTKVYPHFAEVIALLRQRFPALAVVQLGTTTSRPLASVTLNLIDKTTMRETAAILGNALLHLDNEGGLVHLAACLGVKSCVVFGPTNADFFAYDNNINIRPAFCGNCWWMTRDWMFTCLRGFNEPRCLSEQPPEAIVEAVVPHLTNALKEAR